MRDLVTKEISSFVSNTPKDFGDVVLTLCDYYKGLG